MAEFMNARKTKYYKPRGDTSDENYKLLYRFSRESVEWIGANFLGEESGETRGGAISNINKLKIFLRYMADPGFQGGIGEELGVHQTTISKIVKEISHKIVAHSDRWIKFPKSIAELNLAKQNWHSKYRFPCVVGVIDCTHVRIKKPHIHGDEYINRKGYASINVQATCDSDERFTSVDASWPGSVHDSRIWNNSGIYDVAKGHNFATTGVILLGDEGYGIAPWLMVPFRAPNSPQEHAYNNLFTKERSIIERCFGQLKQRFSILQYKIRLALDQVPTVI